MARGKAEAEEVDPTGWMLTSTAAEFLLLHTKEIKYLCMLGYTYMHGCKIFGSFSATTPFSYKFVRMIMQCTGGGILVPIFINALPVPLSTDAYPIAIFVSFVLHTYAPVLREVLTLSPVFKGAIVVLYETMRASVVVKLTTAAGAAISPSEFSIPLFGPIFCGTVAGCGGAFLPFDKGLSPLDKGMAPNMLSAFIAATFYHLFTNTTMSEGVIEPAKKAHLVVAIFFVSYGLYLDAGLSLFFKPRLPSKAKKED